MLQSQPISDTCRELLPFLMSPKTGARMYSDIFKAFQAGISPNSAAMAEFLRSSGQAKDAQILESIPDWDSCRRAADKQVKQAGQFNARILCALDPEYPQLLAATESDSPGFLFVRGSLKAPDARSVAVIGSRTPTEHGSIIAERITRYLSQNAVSIVSGLALGCDAIAHRTAIECNGHTVAVLAHGLQTVQPSENRELAKRILEGGGALVSTYPFGTEVSRFNFADRDKYQAGLSEAVVMVQSSVSGGSLNAALRCLRYGRRLVVPYPTETDQTRNRELVEGNMILATCDPDRIIEGFRNRKRSLVQKDIRAGAAGIVVLHGREDYPKILDIPASRPQPEAAPSTGALF